MSLFSKNGKILFYARLFSLDIIAGAVGGTYYFSKLFEVKIHLYWISALVLSLLTIYFSDHIFDKLNNRDKNSHFFSKYRQLLIYAVILIALIDIMVIIKFFPVHLVKLSLFSGMGVVLHFALIHLFNMKHVKEILISIMYTCVIIFIPVFYLKTIPDIYKLMIIFSYFFLVFANVFMFTYQDFNHLNHKRIVIVLLLVSLALNAIMLLLNNLSPIFSLIQVFMAIPMLFAVTKKQQLLKHNHYGLITDGVFSFSFLALFI